MMSSSSVVSSLPSRDDDDRHNAENTKKGETKGGAQQQPTSLASYLDSISSSLAACKLETSTLHHHQQQHNTSMEVEDTAKTTTNKIHFILGNEAGDADSIISALTLGYVMTLEDHYCRYYDYNKNYCDEDIRTSSSSGNTNIMPREFVAVVVPIASVPRADLSLRRDVVLLLELSGLNVTQLPCLDDECICTCLQEPNNGRVTLTLVDHNRIRSSLSHLSELVTEILDHHEDEGCHLVTTISTSTSTSGAAISNSRRIIAFEDGRATVASTCTLVVERLFALLAVINKNRDDASSTSITKIDGSLGLLLLGVILLDTINMSPTAGRGTLRDAQAITMLLEQTDWSSLHRQQLPHPQRSSTGISKMKKTNEEVSHSLEWNMIFPFHDHNNSSSKNGGAPNTTALFEVLSNSRSDKKFWMGASVSDCLRMDYKKFMVPSSQSPSSASFQSSSISISSIGISTVLLSMDELLTKNNFRVDLSTYVASSDVDLFGVLTLDLRANDDGGRTAIRGLMLASLHRDVVDSYTAFLLNGKDAAFLELVECKTMAEKDFGIDEAGTTIHIRVFQQGNARIGRKQIAPILLSGATSVTRGIPRL